MIFVLQSGDPADFGRLSPVAPACADTASHRAITSIIVQEESGGWRSHHRCLCGSLCDRWRTRTVTIGWTATVTCCCLADHTRPVTALPSPASHPRSYSAPAPCTGSVVPARTSPHHATSAGRKLVPGTGRRPNFQSLHYCNSTSRMHYGHIKERFNRCAEPSV